MASLGSRGMVMVFKKKSMFAVLALLLPMPACHQDRLAQSFFRKHAPEKTSMVETKPDKMPSAAKVKEVLRDAPEYNYTSFGRSDPFKPPMSDKAPTRSLAMSIVSPLQKYRLDQLELVGIWQTGIGSPKAMVAAPDNISYTVKIGDPIGNHGGKVKGIGKKNVTVREFTLLANGRKKFSTSSLYFYGEEPEKKDQEFYIIPVEQKKQMSH